MRGRYVPIALTDTKYLSWISLQFPQGHPRCVFLRFAAADLTRLLSAPPLKVQLLVV